MPRLFPSITTGRIGGLRTKSESTTTGAGCLFRVDWFGFSKLLNGVEGLLVAADAFFDGTAEVVDQQGDIDTVSRRLGQGRIASDQSVQILQDGIG